MSVLNEHFAFIQSVNCCVLRLSFFIILIPVDVYSNSSNTYVYIYSNSSTYILILECMYIHISKIMSNIAPQLILQFLPSDSIVIFMFLFFFVNHFEVLRWCFRVLDTLCLWDFCILILCVSLIVCVALTCLDLDPKLLLRARPCVFCSWDLWVCVLAGFAFVEEGARVRLPLPFPIPMPLHHT